MTNEQPVAWRHKKTGMLQREDRPKGAEFNVDDWEPLYLRPSSIDDATKPVPLLVCSETIRKAILRGDPWAAGLASGLASLAKEKGFPNYAVGANEGK